MQLNRQGFFGPLWAKILFLLTVMLFAANASHAQFATGGSSPYQDQVLWLTWGDGPTGMAEQDLNIGASSSSSFLVPGGQEMELQCSIDAITHEPRGPQQLRSYQPGEFFGDALDNLYNIGGEGFSNQLINGIERSDGITDFTIGCTATLDGQPYDLKGLVMADAEAIRPNDEYVEATADGTWNVVEMVKNLGDPDPYIAEKTNNVDGTQTIRFGPGTDFETAAVTFLSFNNPSSNFDMDFSIRGGDVTGTTAIAIGLLVHYADLGDAPASYGDAIHLIQDVDFEDDNLPADGGAQDLNVAGYEPGGLASSTPNYIGSEGVDTELEQPYGADAEGDDNFPTSGSTEEDAWPDNYTISALQVGQNLSESIACNGTGTVAGWIDFDRNGTFDSDERAEAICSGGATTLSWTVPTDITAGVSYVRLRYSTNPADVTNPTGTAVNGEVEDHAIEIQADADLGVVKTVDQPSAMVGDDVTFTLIATNDGPSDATNVVVNDQLPDGYAFVSASPAGEYNQSTGEWTIGDLADQGNTTLQITATVLGSGNYTNTAVITGDEADSNNNNNSASRTITTSSLPSFQTCSDELFLSQASSSANPMDLIQIDQSSNPFGYQNVLGTEPNAYNATAFNETDDYLYAIRQAGPNRGHLIRLGSNGNVEDLGAISGFSGSSIAGEIDPSGNYYLRSGSNTIAVVDIPSTSVTRTINLSTTPPGNFVDLAWHNGMLYTVSTNNSGLYSIDPNDGTTTRVGSIGIGNQTFGALFGGENGVYGSANGGAGFFQFNTSTGGATLISDSPGASTNDGAKCASSRLTYEGDLTISKTDNQSTYTPGETVTYEIVAGNDGPFGASGAVVNDPLPSGITASDVSWTCTEAGGATCGMSSGTGNIDGVEVDLPLDATATFELTIQVPADYTGTLANTATLTPGQGTDDPTPNNTSTDENDPDPQSDLSVTKSVDEANPAVGEEVTFTLTATNNGPSDAQNVSVTEQLPDGYEFVNSSASVGSYNETNGTWTIGALANGASATLDITATVQVSGAYENTATVESDTPDPDPGNNTDTSTPAPIASADVAINKTLDTTGGYVAGQEVNYTLTVTNNGPSTATNVEVSDIPTNLTITAVSGQGCSGNTFPCTIPTLANGETTDITITATINAEGSFDNTGSVSADENDPDQANNTDDEGNGGTADPSADIVVEKTLQTQGPFNAGQSVDYQLTISNDGPSDASNINVTDTPSNVSITGVSGACSTFPCSITSLADGEAVTVNVTGTIDSEGSFGNTAMANADQNDPDETNNSDADGGNSEPAADMAITKVLDSSGPFNAGDEVSFSVNVLNNGPSQATGVVIEDVPTNMTITGVSGSGCSSFPCTIGSLASGGQTSLQVTATIDAAGNFSNEASVTANEYDPDENNNSNSAGDNGEAAADVAVTKVLNTTGPFNVGDEVVFSVNVANNGPSQATGVIVDDVPSNLTITDVSGAGCSTFPCTIGALMDGEDTNIQVTATIDAAGTFSNQATAAGNEYDPNQNNNEDTASDNGNAAADLAVDKTLDTTGPYLAGQEVTYTLSVQNNGPSDAQNVTINDTPTNLTVTSISSPNCDTFPCTLETLGNGHQEEITVTATIDAEGEFTNASTVSSDTNDPKPDNNTDDEDDNGGTADPSADIAIDKELNTSGPYNAGDQITYTLTINNKGPSGATDIEVTDTPTNLNVDNVSGACSTLPCSISSLASSEQTSITVQATIVAAGVFDNEATATPAENDPNQENNTDDEENGGSADPAADIAVTKTLTTDGPYNAGESVTFEVLIANNGPSDATNIDVNDSPTNLTLSTISGACSTLPCTIPALASGDETVIMVEATIDEAGSFSNIAKATASEKDPIPKNNSGRDGDSGGLLADLSLTKSIGTPGPYVDGQQIEYTITVSNAGPSEATGALVIDTPTNLIIDQVSGACSTLPCDLSSVPAGSQREITLLATIDEPGSFNNVATINAAQDDPDPENNTDEDGSSSTASANISVNKTLDTAGPYVDGQQVQYSMVIRNDGPSEATNVEVTDTPTNLSIANVSGACTTLPCTIRSIPKGEQKVITVMATIQQPGAFDNVVTVTADEDDPKPSNNTDGDGNGGSADASADLSITKSVDNATPKVGEQVTFTLSALNNGPSDAEGVEVSDQLPDGYEFEGAMSSVGNYDANTGRWQLGTLDEAESATLDITATVLNTADYANTTSISSDTPDPDPGNNDGISTTDPSPAADIIITKVLNTEGPYAAGQQLDYTITIRNEGPSQSTGIEVTDTPTNLTIDGVTGSGCSNFPCTIPSLDSGNETTVNVTATINGQGAFGNTATASGNENDPNPENNTDRDGDNGGLSSDIAMTKTLVTSGPYTDGQQVEYSLLITNNGPSDATGVLVQDQPTNLIIDEVQGACANLPCTIASIPNGQQETITVLATIDGDGRFDNAATATPTEGDPDTSNNTDDNGNNGNANASADISLDKTLTTAGPYSAGQQVEYNLVISNNGPSEANGVTITESPTNLTINKVSGSGCNGFPCSINSLAAGQQRTVNVTATIDAKGAFNNAATVTSTVDDPDLSDNTDGDTDNGGSADAAVDVSLTKTLNTTGPYQVSQDISYSLLIANEGPSEATNIEVTDTPDNLSIVGVSGSGCSTLPCTIPSLAAGAQTTIDVQATIENSGEFDNSATASPSENDADGSNNTDNSGGAADARADISIVKSLQTAAPFQAGQEVTYRLIVMNDGPSVATNIKVSDTPQNLTLNSVAGACSELPCTISSLEDGEQKTIDVIATIAGGGRFDNVANAESEEVTDPEMNNNVDDDQNNGGSAQKITDVSVDKSLITEGPYTAGQEIEYSITVANSGPSTATSIEISDTPTNMNIAEVTGSDCTGFPCTVPSLEAGEETKITVLTTIQAAGPFDNSASVDLAEEDANMDNNVDATGNGATAQAPELRIIKQAQNLTVQPGGFVPYTIMVDNLSEVPVTDVQIIDTPPLGLSYVEKSLGVVDEDNSGLVEGIRPFIIGDIDLAPGGQATITYIMRVGATAVPGELRNLAVASKNGTQLSDEDDASVMLEGDPIIDETRILGTVFRDHDQDGYQDIANATSLHAKGGFNAGVYVDGSTTVDFGNGPVAVPDASVPLLNGLDLGDLEGRHSLSSALDDQRIIISQRVTEPEFTNDFELTTNEGSKVTITASGQVNHKKSGKVKRGVNSQQMQVERNVTELSNGQYRIDYIITNAGFDDWGLPGARLATPRGLVVETDGYGRYHIEAVETGDWRRGRNFIVKVDDSSLPRNSSYSTENPLVRRITNAAPVRFDFGIYIPTADIAVEKRLLTDEPYEAGDAIEYELKITNNGPATANDIKIDDRGKNISITEIEGGGCDGFPCTLDQSLDAGESITLSVNATVDTASTFENKAAALASEDDPLPDNNIDLVSSTLIPDTTTTSEPAPEPMTGCEKAVMIPRAIHFETDKSVINVAAAQMLDQVADFMLKRRNCSVNIIGHTDHDLDYEYNKALSLRRANAIRAYLHTAGVKTDQITLDGVSFSKPVVSEEQDILDKALNRRASFKFTPSSGDTLLQQIEDLQVDAEPQDWDYVFDFRHNAVPGQIHFIKDEAALNKITKYIIKRIAYVLESYPAVKAHFTLDPSGRAKLDEERIKILRNTLVSSGVAASKFKIEVDYSGSRTVGGEAHINYVPGEKLIRVQQNDDLKLDPTQGYPELLDKAWKMLQNREDQPLYNAMPDSLQMPKGIKVSENKKLSIEAAAGLSRLGSYLTDYPQQEVALISKPSVNNQLRQAQRYLEDWGIDVSRIYIKTENDSSLPDNFIRFKAK